MLKASIQRWDSVRCNCGEEWDSLARISRASIFQTSAWYQAWCETVAASEHVEPLVINIHRNDKLCAGLALQIRKTDNGERMEMLSTPWADYHHAIVNPRDDEAIHALRGVLTDLISKSSMALAFDELCVGSPLVRILIDIGLVCREGRAIEAIDLTDQDHVRSILERREYRMKERRIARLGLVSCAHHSDQQSILARLPVFIAMHRAQWKDRPDAIASFDGSVIDEAFRGFVRYLAPQNSIILTEFGVGQQCAAIYFGFRFEDWYGGYRTTFAQSLFKLSPGHLMLRRMIADFQIQGIKVFDLMRGDYAYKREYTNRHGHNLLIADE
jgi:CelD/BcsL family acetyltransferase involved in cellulose biosynthesis